MTRIPGFALMLFLFCNDSSFQNAIFMAVKNRDNRPYLTYSKAILYAQPFPTRNHLGSREKSLHFRNSDDEIEPGFVGHMQPLPEATSRLNQDADFLKWMKFRGFLVLRVGGYGWLSLVIPGRNPFSLGFPALIVDNQPKSPKTAARKASNIPKKTDQTAKNPFNLSSVSLQLSPTLSSKTRPGSFHPGLCMQLLKSWR